MQAGIVFAKIQCCNPPEKGLLVGMPIHNCLDRAKKDAPETSPCAIVLMFS